MSGSLQRNVTDTTVNKSVKKATENNRCMQMDNILNTYCELVMRLKKLGTNEL